MTHKELLYYDTRYAEGYIWGLEKLLLSLRNKTIIRLKDSGKCTDEEIAFYTDTTVETVMEVIAGRENERKEHDELKRLVERYMQGVKMGEERFAKLLEILCEKGEIEKIKQAADDRAVRGQLYEKYGL